MNIRRERGGKTTWFQREAMLQWLEVEANFKLMTGEATHGMKMVVAGARVTKATAYQELALYVNQKCNTHWDGRASESRFRAYKKLYIDTKKKFEDPSGPKFCLSDADIAKGCNTIEKKLEAECPGYARMDILFGNKQNVKPHSTMQSGLNLLLQATEWDSDSEDEEQADEGSKEDGNLLPLVDVDSTPEAVITNASINNDLQVECVTSIKKVKRIDGMPESLKALCTATIKVHSEDLPNKLSEGKKQKTSQGLTAAYSDAKKAEAALGKEALEWKIQHEKELLALNKENHFDELRIKQQEVDIKAKAVTEQTKRELTLKLIDQGKAPAQIQEYLEAFGYL